jgi:hypothetical protein
MSSFLFLLFRRLASSPVGLLAYFYY